MPLPSPGHGPSATHLLSHEVQKLRTPRLLDMARALRLVLARTYPFSDESLSSPLAHSPTQSILPHLLPRLDARILSLLHHLLPHHTDAQQVLIRLHHPNTHRTHPPLSP